MKKNHLLALGGLLAVSFAGSFAQAALLNGQTVRYQYLFPNVSTACGGSQTAVVGSGVEFASNAVGSCSSSSPVRDWFSVDLSDTEILISFTEDFSGADTSFNGFSISDANGTIPSFTGVSLLAERGPFSSSRLSFTANSIIFNFDALQFDGSGDNRDFIRVGVSGPTATAVPEPGTLALLGLGLAGLGLVRRKRAI